MKRLYCLFLLLISFSSVQVFGQDTLPKFSVRYVGNNRVIIGWVNQFDTVKQISIQRSHDSLRNYKTIMSVADPNAVQNGFADTKAPNDHMYYRLFVVRNGGQFFFTAARKPMMDTARQASVAGSLPGISVPGAGPGKDSARNGVKEQVKKEEVKKVETFVPSFYVNTNKNGYVFINLPDADKKKYRIRFYEADNTLLFEIKNIKETGLILDKANFLHSGWFHFELYNDQDLVERHRFYLAKEF